MTQLHARMRSRPTDEEHRVSSPLELLFDLTFVVAIASVVVQLAHKIAEGHAGNGIVPFMQVFFAIWWAWMNFTWFASSYDTDDVPYRLLTMLQMAGVLLLAAGVPSASNSDNYRAVTIGYAIMRIALVAQWLRAGIEDPESRGLAFRYAAGIFVVQLGWLLRLALVEAGAIGGASLPWIFLLLVVFELAVPPWAEHIVKTSWHPHHIAERYGLFTIIVLGESVLAASTGLNGALAEGHVSGSLITVSIAGLVLLFALWWLYFLEPAGEGLEHHRERSYLWGYGHYFIFAALAVLGGGLEVAVERAGHDVEVSAMGAGYAVAIPVAIFLLSLYAVHAPIVARPVIPLAATLAATAAVLLVPLAASRAGVPAVVVALTVVCVIVIAVTIAVEHPRAEREEATLTVSP
jgi:low temperature requirement protein LtrA